MTAAVMSASIPVHHVSVNIVHSDDSTCGKTLRGFQSQYIVHVLLCFTVLCTSNIGLIELRVSSVL